MVNIKGIKENIIAFKDETEIVEEEYDGSYVLSNKLAELYSEQYFAQLGNDDWKLKIKKEDINLIYYAATINSKKGFYNFIDYTSLNEKRKSDFKATLEEVFEKIESDDPYVNNKESKRKTSGMIGKNINITLDTLNKDDSHYWALVELVIRINKYKKENLDFKPEDLINSLRDDLFTEAIKIPQVAANTLSAILHCNCSSAFPIINGSTSKVVAELIKEFDKKIKNKIVENYKKVCLLMLEHYPCKNYRDLDVLIKQYTSSKTEEKVKAAFLNGSKQVILTGAPGTGKTYSAKEIASHDEEAGSIDVDGKASNYYFVQFHPSFDYTDFVEGLRPIQLKEDQNPTFVRMDGIFKSFCRIAASKIDDGLKYYFIIDEINRADLSKVFGELMYCLEYRGPEGKVKTQYHNLDTFVNTENGPEKIKLDDDIFKDGFYIPENVYIIGTMNDIDRSVESFDFALRRRFKWIEVMTADVNEDILSSFISDADNLKQVLSKLTALNDYIADPENGMGLSEAYQIGAAYFKHIETAVGGKFSSKVINVYRNEVEATLKEYVRGRDQHSIINFLEECRNKFGIKIVKGEYKSKTDKDEEESTEKETTTAEETSNA